MDDWSMPDELMNYSSNGIVENLHKKQVYSSLLNDKNLNMKTKTQKEKLNFSSFKADPGQNNSSIGSSQLVPHCDPNEGKSISASGNGGVGSSQGEGGAASSLDSGK